MRNESNTEIEVKTNVSFIVKGRLPAAVHYVQQMSKVFIDSQSHFSSLFIMVTKFLAKLCRNTDGPENTYIFQLIVSFVDL